MNNTVGKTKVIAMATLAVTIGLAGTAYAAKENFQRDKPHVNAKENKKTDKKKPKEIVVVGAKNKEVEVAPQAAEATAKAKEKRDAASGMATGKRQHKPVNVTKELDKSSPQLKSDDETDKNEQARSKKKKK